MLHYGVVFFVIALIAALFRFTGIAAGATEIAKILFSGFYSDRCSNLHFQPGEEAAMTQWRALRPALTFT
ncbi:MAG: hypothetical protein JWM42_243 [Burkholderia sp.]|jgi:uncharacterized membrane protein YtjA (UPF0391 family)|nr:hypothetical protein [Burkholderia sp.]